MQLVTENVAAIIANNGTAVSAVYSQPAAVGDAQEFPAWTLFRASIFADQAGTLVIQESDDAATWRATTPSQATVASTWIEIESKVMARYVRAVWTNTGGSPTTVVEMHTARVDE